MTSDIRGEHWGVIVNPYSGRRQLQKDWVHIYQLLKKAEIKFEEQLTAFPGHATEIARNMVEKGCRHILIVGGDGTINEVVNGIYTSSIDDKSNVTLALVPYGTGNDWARYWKITRDYRQLARQLFKRKSARIDIGKITYKSKRKKEEIRYFINGAGMGFDGMVINITNRIKKYFGGSSWIYSLSVFIALFTLKSHKMRLTSDSTNIEKDIFTIAVGNACYSGGGLKQTPAAVPTDGYLHITALQRPSFPQVFTAINYLFGGKIDQHPCANVFVTKRFTVDTTAKIYAEADGILIDTSAPYSIEIIPQALHMLVP